MLSHIPLRTVAAALIMGLLTSLSFGQDRFRQMSQRAERNGLAEPFKGVTTDGTVVPGLFTLKSTGVSTEPVRVVANGFLAALTPEQRKKTQFSVDDPEWRKWMNQHFYIRQGVGFNEMTDAQREAAFGLIRASLSAKGLKLTRDIMRLNHTLGELNDNDFASMVSGCIGSPSWASLQQKSLGGGNSTDTT